MSFLLDVVLESWVVAATMAPYLLLGFAIAGVLSVFLSPAWVERHLGGRGWGQVLRASLFGVPLPLCSCGVLPVGASLKRQGASRGATAAFLLSTPQTGVDSIAVTYALLGPFLAVFRPVAAFVSGVLGGWLVHATEEPAGGGSEPTSAATACCAAETSGGPAAGRLRHAFDHAFVALPRDIGRPLILGIVISGLLSVLVEPDLLGRTLGHGLLPMLFAMVIGVPLYVCATASTPIALGLIHAGLSPGAALVFLISGPATNSAALTTLVKVLGKRATVIYLATVMITALASGVVVDVALDRGLVAPDLVVGGAAHVGHGVEHAEHGEAAALTWFEHLAGVLLLLVLVAPMWPRSAGDAAATVAPSEAASVVVGVAGMTCGGCVGAVTRALEGVGGVATVEVSLERGEARLTGTFDGAEVIERVTALGFEITNPEVLARPESC